jgi:hypothetical protein
MSGEAALRSERLGTEAVKTNLKIEGRVRSVAKELKCHDNPHRVKEDAGHHPTGCHLPHVPEKVVVGSVVPTVQSVDRTFVLIVLWQRRSGIRAVE